jgi:hypothetical protein
MEVDGDRPQGAQDHLRGFSSLVAVAVMQTNGAPGRDLRSVDHPTSKTLLRHGLLEFSPSPLATFTQSEIQEAQEWVNFIIGLRDANTAGPIVSTTPISPVFATSWEAIEAAKLAARYAKARSNLAPCTSSMSLLSPPASILLLATKAETMSAVRCTTIS